MNLPIALFADRHILPGLHVTLLSLLEAIPPDAPEWITLHLYLDHVPAAEVTLLEETIARANRPKISIKIEDYSPKAPTGAENDLLYGNQTTYGRLHLPTLLPDAERCLYLDCDLIVHMDVRTIFQSFDGKHILLVDGVGTRRYALEKSLFERVGLDLDGPVFNAGILGIDLGLWRSEGVEERWMRIVAEHGGDLINADQALLNVALHDDFKALGEVCNTQLYPWGARVREAENRIYHLVGSPKPWDVLGRFATAHYGLWHDIYKRTAIGNRSVLRYTSWGRTRRLAGQILKSFVRRLKGA